MLPLCKTKKTTTIEDIRQSTAPKTVAAPPSSRRPCSRSRLQNSRQYTRRNRTTAGVDTAPPPLLLQDASPTRTPPTARGAA